LNAAAEETPGRDLLLVGAGHAHVQVIRRWMMRPLPGVRLTVVVDRPDAVYSGMVPGFVAGDYAPHELEIDAVPLARRAGARVVLSAAGRIDPARRTVELVDRPPLVYDVASLDVGSTVRGLELPGVREHALATRPIRAFVDSLDARLAPLAERARILVVGGGAAGLELAFTLVSRLREAGRAPEVEVLSDGAELMPGRSPAEASRVDLEARRRGIAIRTGARVTAVEKRGVVLANGEAVPGELVVWATGAAPPAVIDASPLGQEPGAFVPVRDTLQTVASDDLFASGDCASLVDHPWVPKAGVYAVRQGPLLDRNLRARLAGRSLTRYRPQRDFLALLHLGERRALGAKWGRVAVGASMWHLKDRIDRRFMARFQVLDAAGAPARRFPSAESMGMGDEEMACGGCAAKLGASSLERALARVGAPPPDESVLLGLESPDDAAALRMPGGDVLLATVDAFRAFCDDPWLVGRVAAVNAVSDVLAKGATPRHALALVTLPEEPDARAEETLYQTLAGVRAALDPLGVTLVGGHTTVGPELFVGLSITGEAPDGVIALAGARPGDRLLLTKPLGTGVLLAADMQGRAAGAWVAEAHRSMLRDNAAAARVATELGATACTDISGFGFAGHLAELLRASGVGARVDLEALPALPGALELLGQGLRSTFHEQNAEGRRGIVGGCATPAFELLFDPQTSGGLLMTVPAAAGEEALARLRSGGDAGAAAVGEVVEADPSGAAFSVSFSG
jgi:selenide,water dikinase